MKIIEKINARFNKMLEDPAFRASFGEKMQNLACTAVAQGINSRVWSDYMRLFASNPAQLARLNGEEAAFNKTTWGLKASAYMVANGCCGSETTAATGISCLEGPAVGTARHMSTDMIDILDNGVPDTDDPAFAD